MSHVGVQRKSILGRGNHQGRGGSVPGVLRTNQEVNVAAAGSEGEMRGS